MVLPARPLRLLPRWAAALLLVLTAVACAWNAAALVQRDEAHTSDIDQRLARGERVDMDLYRQVYRDVDRGVDYYTAATDGNREFGFPTKPFVTVRTPLLAWTTALWGERGWRIVAALLLGANVLAWFATLDRKTTRFERDAAATLAALFGALAFIPQIAFSHEGVAGLLVSLAIPLSATRAWLGGLVVAVLGIAFRELAFPFLFAWAFVELVAGQWKRLLALSAAIAVVAFGLWLHAMGVAAARLPDDTTSPGWMGLLGPSLPLYGIHLTTLLQVLPVWIAGPLGLLALLGWVGAGGRLGMLGTVWFGGFIAAVAVVARQENFYWMALFAPAYGVGLAFVPRALADLWNALRPRTVRESTP